MTQNLKLCLFVIVGLLVVLVEPAFAADGGAGMGDWGKFGAMIGIGIAVAGGAIGQAKAASSALEGISRNPGAVSQMFTPLLLGLALIESLVLFAFLITSGLI